MCVREVRARDVRERLPTLELRRALFVCVFLCVSVSLMHTHVHIYTHARTHARTQTDTETLEHKGALTFSLFLSLPPHQPLNTKELASSGTYLHIECCCMGPANRLIDHLFPPPSLPLSQRRLLGQLQRQQLRQHITISPHAP